MLKIFSQKWFPDKCFQTCSLWCSIHVIRSYHVRKVGTFLLPSPFVILGIVFSLRYLYRETLLVTGTTSLRRPVPTGESLSLVFLFLELEWQKRGRVKNGSEGWPVWVIFDLPIPPTHSVKGSSLSNRSLLPPLTTSRPSCIDTIIVLLTFLDIYLKFET